MKMRAIFTLLFCSFVVFGFAQTDSVTHNNTANIFNRIAKSINEYKLDTTTAPNDKITKLIIELRGLKGGFNINEAIAFKIEEDRQKNEIPKTELDKIASFFSTGEGKRWLDNATIWIYRQHFTYEELKQLVKFYKTSAGQKMATDFPIIMLRSLKAAEMIKDLFLAQQKAAL